MAPEHLHPAGSGPSPAAVLAAAVAAAVVAGYLLAALRLRRRGDVWPPSRDLCFAAGGTALAAAAVLDPPGGPFTAHMAGHLVTGMAAPLLLVLARPLTLVLRVLGPGPLRRALLAAAHSRPAGWLLFPPLAAAVDVGGLWLLYRTPLWAAAHGRPLLAAVLHLHVLAAGVLFTFAVCRLDPVRRRWGLPWRGAALLGAGAAHAVLAKSLYAAPPPGTGLAGADLRTGAQLMYYGGDLVEVALAAVLAVQWYAATGRALARGRRAVRGSAPARHPVPGGAPDACSPGRWVSGGHSPRGSHTAVSGAVALTQPAAGTSVPEPVGRRLPRPDPPPEEP
ncbi:cytochrome c oxidase assembly protein [Streptomyces carminius]|uniref:Cytochrome c oxidase assembly protein n=1 Tax=Streptomyces carminius TaxID=2665496 RepID=A0A2M8M1E1_9ACTN|nr:cytochrome c oxidase assembly protein [Streptomyces carminius]PJE98023.1 cytochrome c oxidase assembly protein [Streptomyces carminius]PJF01849.1 cytochrome c oxidase assembly protein [Streptomyces carminius]